jgi:hypothetical protein
VENGIRTEAEYIQWKKGQLAVGQRWSAQKQIIAEQLYKTNEKAKDIYKSAAPEIFADNANYATYDIEKQAHVDTSFMLYNKDAVERLIKEDPEVLPPVGKKVAKEIAEGKAVRWNRQQLQSVMMQGILQGDSIPKLASRLANTVGDRNRKAAIRNARTMATMAQNAGRENAFKRAKSKGVELDQMWLATLDARTRNSHRWLDHEVRPVGEQFSNGLEYPGDPHGDASEIYNCRCSLRGVVKGLERRSGLYRDDSAIGGMSYDEWKKTKPVARDIEHQDKVGKAQKANSIHSYQTDGYYLVKHGSDGPMALSRVYVNKDDELFYALSNVTPEPGFEDFGMHGTPDSVEYYTNSGTRTYYNAHEFADILRADNAYNGGNIRLLSCNTGGSSEGFAQQLANELKVDVKAPTEPLWVDENGNMFITDSEVLAQMWYDGEKVNPTGVFKVFHPR